MLCSSSPSTRLARQGTHADHTMEVGTAKITQSSPDAKLVLFRCLPKGEDGPANLTWVHPDGTGLHALTQAPADKQYFGLSFSPSFSEGEG